MADHGTEDSFDISFTEALKKRQEQAAVDKSVFQAAGLEDQRDALDATFTPEELSQTPEDAPGSTFDDGLDTGPTEQEVGFLGTVADVGEQLIGGVRDAGVNTLQTIADVGGLLDSGINFDELIPDVDQAETGVGAFARGTATFLTGFIPVLGAMRALRATKAVAGILNSTRASGAAGRALTGEVAKFTAAGAITDFAVFDPHAQRLSNLAVEYGFDNAIFQALSATPEDGEFTGRLKSVIEGAGLGLMADGILNGLRFSARWAKTQRGLADEVIVAPAARAAVHASGAKVTFLRQHYADLKSIREDWAALGKTSGDETVAVARAQLDKGVSSASRQDPIRDAKELTFEQWGGKWEGRFKPGILTEEGEFVTGIDHGDALVRAEDSGFTVVDPSQLGQRSGWKVGSEVVLSKDLEADGAEEIYDLLRTRESGPSTATSADQLVQLAELRAGQSGRTVREEFDDIALPMDEAAVSESALGLIEGSAPALAGDIRRMHGNLDELDSQIEQAFDNLGVAEEEYYEAVTSDGWRELYDDVRLPAERIVDNFVPKNIKGEVKEFRRFNDSVNCPL